MSMDQQKLLRIQSYLDHELSANDAVRVAEWLADDSEARAVYDELRQTRALLVENEPQWTVPETREFYWSRIEREISRVRKSEPGGFFGWPTNWRRLVLPVGGAAAMIALIFALSGPEMGTSAQEIESPQLEVNSITFRHQEAGMTIVWIENQAPYWSEVDSND